MKTKDVVVGLGEIGNPILKLFSKSTNIVGYDINPKLMNKKKFEENEIHETVFLHVCIPFSNTFVKNVEQIYKKFMPKCIVIHSTISPNTTKKIQHKLPIPVIYSATRGVHSRMLNDLKRYSKFFAVESNAPQKKWAVTNFSKLLKKSKVKPIQISNPLTLELAKIVCDTSYYGWLINYAQISNIIAQKHKVDFDEMWSFSDEIHKFLGNRPKMFPGYIGGHCVVPNLELIDEKDLWQIDKINNYYSTKVKNAKSINRKYDKSKKQSYDV